MFLSFINESVLCGCRPKAATSCVGQFVPCANRNAEIVVQSGNDQRRPFFVYRPGHDDSIA